MLKHAGLSLQRERCITYLPTSRLGMDVVNNLVTSAPSAWVGHTDCLRPFPELVYLSQSRSLPSPRSLLRELFTLSLLAQLIYKTHIYGRYHLNFTRVSM